MMLSSAASLSTITPYDRHGNSGAAATVTVPALGSDATADRSAADWGVLGRGGRADRPVERESEFHAAVGQAEIAGRVERDFPVELQLADVAAGLGRDVEAGRGTWGTGWGGACRRGRSRRTR